MKNKYWEKRYSAELIEITKDQYISNYSSIYPNLKINAHFSIYYYLKEIKLGEMSNLILDSDLIQIDRIRLLGLDDIIIISCPKIIFNWVFFGENETNFWKLIHSAEDRLGDRDYNSLYKIILN